MILERVNDDPHLNAKNHIIKIFIFVQTEAAKVKGLLLTQKKSLLKVAQNQLLKMFLKKIVHPPVQRICEISV